MRRLRWVADGGASKVATLSRVRFMGLSGSSSSVAKQSSLGVRLCEIKILRRRG